MVLHGITNDSQKADEKAKEFETGFKAKCSGGTQTFVYEPHSAASNEPFSIDQETQAIEFTCTTCGDAVSYPVGVVAVEGEDLTALEEAVSEAKSSCIALGGWTVSVTDDTGEPASFDGEATFTVSLPAPEDVADGAALDIWMLQEDDSVELLDTSAMVEGRKATFTTKTLGTFAFGDTLKPTLTFQTNGGTPIEEKVYEFGEVPGELPTPVREGYEFTGWYVDEACTKEFDFTKQLYEDATVYAGWSAVQTIVTRENKEGASFSHTVTGGDDLALWRGLDLVTDPVEGAEQKTVSDFVKAAVQGVKNLYVLDIHLVASDGSLFTIPTGDTVTVTLKFEQYGLSASGLHVYHVAADGTVTDMNALVDAEAGTVSFETSHFSNFVLANVEQVAAGTGDATTPAKGAAATTVKGLASTGDPVSDAAVALALVSLMTGAVALAARKKSAASVRSK